MKVIFAGTPEFAIPPLKALLASEHQVVAVYTQPDRPAGRGQKLTASPVKQLALLHNIPVCQPTTLREPSVQQTLQQWQADVMIVVAYGLILPAAVLSIPPLGCINIHASLLPRWRGAAPIQHAILAGDTESGITIMQMDAGLDTGPLLQQVRCPIHITDTSQDLHDRLTALGAEALLTALKNLPGNSRTQNNDEACYAAKIEKAEAELDWRQSAEQLDRVIRAFNPWPIAYTTCGAQTLRIWRTQIIKGETGRLPGTLIQTDKSGIVVATGNGLLRLLTIQLPGGKPLPVSEILNARAELLAPGLRFCHSREHPARHSRERGNPVKT